MKVYIVDEGYYEPDIVGIYINKEKAEKYIEARTKAYAEYGSKYFGRIYEHDLIE